MLKSSAEESTGAWLVGKSAFGRLLFSRGLMKTLVATMPQTTMTLDGPLEMNRVGCSLELPSDFVPLN